MTYEEILFRKEGNIGVVTLNNPSKANALSINMIKELTNALTEISMDEDLKVVILKASGKHFCAGHNLAEMVENKETGAKPGVKEYKGLFDRCAIMMELIHRLPQPVIAEVQGVATAAGCQLAAWCDMTVCEEGARFGTPGVKIGLFCATPMIAISRVIGRKAAMEMLMTGKLISAHEAKELGLVNRVVPIEKLSEETMEMAKTIAQASRFVIALGKEAFYTQIDQPDGKAMDYARHTMAMNNLAEDAQCGISCFLKKKTPEWKNR